MSKLSRSKFSNLLGMALTGLATALMLLSFPCKSRAGINIGTKPINMSDPEYYKLAVEDAEKDLIRKKQVGQIRYDKRMAQREQMINGMRSQLEARRQLIVVPPPVAPAAPAEKGIDFAGILIWTLAIAVMGTAGWQYWRSRQISLAPA